jgi:tetratricopeptide (TPR) repeat protein
MTLAVVNAPRDIVIESVSVAPFIDDDTVDPHAVVLDGALILARAAYTSGRYDVAREIATMVYNQARPALLAELAAQAACLQAAISLHDHRYDHARRWAQQARQACPINRAGLWAAVATLLLAHAHRAMNNTALADRFEDDALRLVPDALDSHPGIHQTTAIEWLGRLLAPEPFTITDRATSRLVY